MQVSVGMSNVVLTVNPGHTLRDAATQMAERSVGAAVVIDPEQPGPGIITERDILQSIGRGENPDEESVSDHLSSDLTFAAPDWSLERAAEAMVRGCFATSWWSTGAGWWGSSPCATSCACGSPTGPRASCRRTYPQWADRAGPRRSTETLIERFAWIAVWQTGTCAPA